jgi:hypothetical protein
VRGGDWRGKSCGRRFGRYLSRVETTPRPAHQHLPALCLVCRQSSSLSPQRRSRRRWLELDCQVVKHAGARCSLHLQLAAASREHRGAFACAPCPLYPALLSRLDNRCYLIAVAAHREERRAECSSSYLSLDLLLPVRLGVASTPAASLAVPSTYLAHPLLPPPALLDPWSTTLPLYPPPSLHPPLASIPAGPQPCADKVPRSHSTALAPCIGSARVNTAQSALDPDPLSASCSASRPLAPPTDAPAIILIRLPAQTAFPPNSHPPFDYSVSCAPATCLLCAALPALHRTARLPASRLPVHSRTQHFLAAPPTTVSCCRPHTILAVSR